MRRIGGMHGQEPLCSCCGLGQNGQAVSVHAGVPRGTPAPTLRQSTDLVSACLPCYIRTSRHEQRSTEAVMEKKRLGRGLDALLGVETARDEQAEAPVAMIAENPHQPRKN